MEKYIKLKVIYDDGYKLEAIRPFIGPKLGIGRVLMLDVAELQDKVEIFNEEVSRPSTAEHTVKTRKN